MNQVQSPLNPTSQKSLYAVLFLNTELEHFEILAKCAKSWCGHVHTLSTLCPHFCEYLFQLQFKIISWALKHRFLHWKSLLYIFPHFFTKKNCCCIIWCWNSMISINHIKNGGKTCSIIVHYQNTPRIRVKRWWTWTKTFLGVIIFIDIQCPAVPISRQSGYDRILVSFLSGVDRCGQSVDKVWTNCPHQK